MEEFLNNISSFLFLSKDRIKLSFVSFEGKLIYEKEYSKCTSMKNVKEDFLNHLSEENIIKVLDIKENYYKNNLAFYIKINTQFERILDDKLIQDFIINFNEKDKNFDSMRTNSMLPVLTNLKIYVKKENKYNKLSKDMEEYIINSTYLIGRPILNEHRYYLYNKNNKRMDIVKYPREQRKQLKIKNYLGTSSYCNALNNLYIYEGNNVQNFSRDQNNFIRINLIKNEINIISSSFPNRILHSMIFIPECYIFIVGGKNVKNVIVYIIQENNRIYEQYPHKLPYEILEPSLIYINNRYLYAFENSVLDFHILKTDLIKVKPFKEIIIKNNKFNINQKFFGVVRFGNSILFLGGQMLNLFNDSSNKCFIFNFKDDTIERGKKEFKPFEFIEKSFIPIKRGTFFQFAEFKNENKYIPKKVIFIDQFEND